MEQKQEVQPFAVESCTSPRWGNASKTEIFCTVKFAGLNETVPFNATSFAAEEYCVTLFSDLVAGKYGPIADYIPPPPTPPRPGTGAAVAGKVIDP